MTRRPGIPVASALAIAVISAVATILIVVAVAARHGTGTSAAAPPAPATSTHPSPSPSTDAVANTPAGIATAFVGAFTDQTLTGAAWEQTYDTYLTTQARQAYQYTDKSQVPGTRITGAATTTTPGSSAQGSEDAGDDDPAPAVVDVPTDAGAYVVDLQNIDGRWQVVSATPPGEQ